LAAIAANAALHPIDGAHDGAAVAGSLASMKQAMVAFAVPPPLDHAHDPPTPVEPMPVLAPPVQDPQHAGHPP
jgi:hypothetical protein